MGPGVGDFLAREKKGYSSELSGHFQNRGVYSNPVLFSAQN
jgi:hypothetical protein